jgi:hypothetical protein
VEGQQVLDANCRNQERRQSTPAPPIVPKNFGAGSSSDSYEQSRLDSSSTSLDITLQNRALDSKPSNCQTNRYAWSSKQKRAYVKAKAGERCHPGQQQRFLTLTSSPGSVEAGNDLGIDFSVFKLRVKRLTPYKLYKKGYLTIGQARFFYPGKNLHQPLAMDYFKVRTDEGYGVLHILYYGDYIPQKWLSDTWDSIHKAPITWIKTGDYLKYVINQYCSGQSRFINSSCNDGWAFKGYMRTWDYLRRFMPLDKRIEVMQVLQEFGKVEIVHHNQRELLEAGQPPPHPVVVFIGCYDPLEGRMVGSWVDRSQAERDAFGEWKLKEESESERNA